MASEIEGEYSMRNRQKVLTQKAEEIRTQLIEWANQGLPLKPHEFITISVVLKIEIRRKRKKEPIVMIRQVTIKTPKTKTTDATITEDDWKKILSLPFSGRQEITLGFFRKSDNKPLLAEKIGELLSEKGFYGGFSPHRIGLINSVFIRSETNYRLRSIDYGLNWNRERFKLVIVE